MPSILFVPRLDLKDAIDFVFSYSLYTDQILPDPALSVGSVFIVIAFNAFARFLLDYKKFLCAKIVV